MRQKHFQARGTWPSLKQPIPSHYSKSCRLDSLRDMSLAFGVSHLPGGHKPSRPASLGYRLPLSIVAGIWQASSTEARHTHHVRLRNPRSNAELYQKCPAYAPNLQFPSRLHRNNSNRVREACRGQHGARMCFLARDERFRSFRPAQAESGSPRLPGIRSPWSWETWPGIPKKRCLQGIIVACVSGFFQAHAAVGLPCTVPGHGGPKAVQTGQNCGDIRHTSKVGVHINPLGDLIVWVNGEQANVCILISGSPPETLRGFAGPSDCHQPHGGQSK